jgi:carbon starvation protein
MDLGSINVLYPLFITILIFGIAYRFYGRYISNIFESDDRNLTPACSISDCRDYVPSKGLVVFSHHFSSIAGGGPIIGPTIALLYGFYPSWLWIIIGAVFFGAVHDLTSLFVSIREKGRSIADITNRTLGKGGYILFILFVIFMVILVTSAFLGLTTTALTSSASPGALGLSPDQEVLKSYVDSEGNIKVRIGGVASTSVIIITILSPFVGFLLYRKRIRVAIASIISVFILSISIIAGLFYPVTIKPELWMIILTIYVFLAAGLPVWLVLQPRDFINSFILYAGIAVLVMGIFAGGLQGLSIRYPSFNIVEGNMKIGLIWPILFITIACGAISGFHSLIASGTTSKQIERESDAKRIGFGAMLLEGLLAVTVLIIVSSCLDFNYYKEIVFPSTAGGKSNPILAFSLSMGKILGISTGIPVYVGTIFGILMIEGFLITTLDTAVRLNRYLFEEIWQVLIKNPPAILRSYLFNAGLSVVLMFIFAYKQAFLSIWPVFGSANQLLAALSLLTVSSWLVKKGKKSAFALIPAVIMLITTIASLLYLLRTKYIPSNNTLLIVFSLILVILSAGIIITAFRQINGKKEGIRIKEVDIITK